ncbi:hypothetical protein BSU04_23680 [Caballeronia sordidicola]|uniref:Uncharacterized protein n=1 Tax=Caballeronia sordidicola TaxID=196367 RepID=A0A226WY16_CABSO|nr:hypothetical protein BSU04_23680 [Caballeronia sordidicola]
MGMARPSEVTAARANAARTSERAVNHTFIARCASRPNYAINLVGLSEY